MRLALVALVAGVVLALNNGVGFVLMHRIAFLCPDTYDCCVLSSEASNYFLYFSSHLFYFIHLISSVAMLLIQCRVGSQFVNITTLGSRTPAMGYNTWNDCLWQLSEPTGK